MLRRELLTPNMFDKEETKELKNIITELYNKVTNQSGFEVVTAFCITDRRYDSTEKRKRPG